MLISDRDHAEKNFVDSLSITEAEDSSYDSDCEADEFGPVHEQVSRTTSDTLGQEFAEYVSQPGVQKDRSPGYTQRVEFALKLGYTERLVQAALCRLGRNPAQNELLAELIKLGAQQGNKEFVCDSPNAECLSPTSEVAANDECPPLSNGLRPIVIDGSNVAMSHGNKEVFSCRGIRLSVDWFKNRGHKEITVFVPKWRKESSRPDHPITDQEILCELERERMLVFTPSRLVGGKRMVCYDDRYILKLAVENDGIVVSNDNYRDLVQESCEFKKVVEERVLMYSFVNDHFMPPDDPLGRSGPTLDNFLRTQPKKGDTPLPCPYGKKCTYGNKCKFHHPERGTGPHKSVTERLSEHAARHLSARNSDGRTPVQGKSLSVPLSSSGETSPVSGCDTRRSALCRTRSGAPDSSAFPSSGSMDLHMGPPPQQQTCYIPNQQHTQQSANQWDLPCRPQDQLPCFPKSHSIENISREAYNSSSHTHPAFGSIWSRQPQSQGHPPLSQKSETDDSVNLHQKLRRQLTLNPAGCDPRIYQMQRNCGMGQQQQQQQQQQQSVHRPLAPSHSGPRLLHQNQWEIHQSVHRIASAPDPSRPWQSGPPPASSSEPQINLWPQQHRGAINAPSSQMNLSTQQALPLAQQAQMSHGAQQQDQRSRLHYHLASIFPEDQVQAVMQMYPEETNPQKICAAILSMFPKM